MRGGEHDKPQFSFFTEEQSENSHVISRSYVTNFFPFDFVTKYLFSYSFFII